MKKGFHFFLAVWMAFSGSPAMALEYSQDQWRTLYQKQIQLVVENYYVMLGKNYADAAFLLSNDIQYASLHAAMNAAQLQQALIHLQGKGTERAEAMRNLLMLKSQAAHLEQNLEQHLRQWDQLKAMQSAQCGTERVESFSTEFSVSSTLAVRSLLAQMKAQLDSVIEQVGDELEFKVSYSIPLGGASTSTPHYQQSKPENVKTPWYETKDGGLSPQGAAYFRELDPIDIAVYTNLSLPERRFIPLDNLFQVNDAPTLQVTIGPADSESDLKKFAGVGGLLGAGVGSFLGPLGTLVGGALGTIIGGIIGEIFSETVLAKWTRILTEQSNFIHAAVAEVERTGTKPVAEAACGKLVNSPSMQKWYAQLEKSIQQSSAYLRGSLEAFRTEYDQGAAQYEEQLDTLLSEVFPIFTASTDSAFEKYFENVKELSQQSKKFVADEIVPKLRPVLKSKSAVERFDAQDTLWDSLIQGQSRYAFEEKKEADRALLYWQPAYQTIRKQLSEVKP